MDSCATTRFLLVRLSYAQLRVDPRAPVAVLGRDAGGACAQACLGAQALATNCGRHRLLLLLARAQVLLHMLGAASESLGTHRLLPAHTHLGRAHSLYHQGELSYQALLLTMRPETQRALRQRFDTMRRKPPQCRQVLVLLRASACFSDGEGIAGIHQTRHGILFYR